MNVVQSYLVTIMRGDFSLYEIRVFMKIVELANQALEHKKVTSFRGSCVSFDGRSCIVNIPIKELLTDNSHHYEEIRQAVKNLQHHVFELREPDKKKWHYTRLLNDIEFAEGDGFLSFTSPKWLLEYIVNFIGDNFSMYDLSQALRLPTPYAVRMYWLTCNMSDTMNFPIDMLRSMLGAKNKYPNVKDFVKRCIESSRRILEDYNVNGFAYSKYYNGRRLAGLQLIPVKREVMSKNQIVAREPVGTWCPPALKNYLQSEAGFTKDGLRNNKALLFEFSRIREWPSIIAKIVGRQQKGGRGAGYVVKAMKSEVKLSKVRQNA